MSRRARRYGPWKRRRRWRRGDDTALGAASPTYVKLAILVSFSLPRDLERSADQAGSRRSILEVHERALLDARAHEINEFVLARLVDREILPFVNDRQVRLEHRGVGLLERSA